MVRGAGHNTLKRVKLSAGAAPEGVKGKKRKLPKPNADAAPTDAAADAGGEGAPPPRKKKLKLKQRQAAKAAEEESIAAVEVAEEKAQQAKAQREADAATSAEPAESFLGVKFTTLRLLESTAKAIAEMGFETLTEIQARSIPPLLRGQDVLAQAKTGSGKVCAALPTLNQPYPKPTLS